MALLTCDNGDAMISVRAAIRSYSYRNAGSRRIGTVLSVFRTDPASVVRDLEAPILPTPVISAESIALQAGKPTRIEPWEDGLKVTYEMVGTRGGVTHTEWTGKFDGKDYPMQGVDTVMTNAYRRIDDRSYEIVIKLDGTLIATARLTFHRTARRWMWERNRKMRAGRRINTTAVYERQ